MAVQKDVKQALTEIPEAKNLVDVVRQAAKEVKLNPVHMIRIAATAIRLNPKLAQCTPASFIGSLIALEQVGLEPVAGRAYLLPFRNKRQVSPGNWQSVPEVQALIGFKGYSDLFYRHEKALTLQAEVVYKNDVFDYELGTDSFLRHKPAKEDRGEAVFYYAVAKMKDGATLFKVMSSEECIAHGKKHSKVFDKKTSKFMDRTPWVTDSEAMSKKTVLLQLTKSLPLSIDMQKAMSIDETSRDYRPGVGDAMDLPDTTNWKEEPEEAVVTKVTTSTSLIPPAVLKSINDAKKRMGDPKFFQILGGVGYASLDDITKPEEATRLVEALANG